MFKRSCKSTWSNSQLGWASRIDRQVGRKVSCIWVKSFPDWCSACHGLSRLISEYLTQRRSRSLRHLIRICKNMLKFWFELKKRAKPYPNIVFDKFTLSLRTRFLKWRPLVFNGVELTIRTLGVFLGTLWFTWLGVICMLESSSPTVSTEHIDVSPDRFLRRRGFNRNHVVMIKKKLSKDWMKLHTLRQIRFRYTC